MTRFPSSKNIITVSILWCLIVFIVIVVILSHQKNQSPIFPTIVAFILVGILVWIILDTRYVFRSGNLLYRSGPFRGRISVQKIKKITFHSGLFVPVTMKPALDTKGFIIRYNEFDDIYVSPKSCKKFVDQLLKINCKIEVVNFNE